MKPRIVLLTIALAFTAIAAHSQAYFTGTIPLPDLKAASVILVTAHTEACGECGFTYAVACAPGHEGCGTPTKQVYDYHPFASIEDARTYLEGNQSAVFIGLYSITPLEVEVHEEDKTIKLPDSHQTVKHYLIKKGSK